MAKIIKGKDPIQFAKSMLDHVIERTEDPSFGKSTSKKKSPIKNNPSPKNSNSVKKTNKPKA